MTAALLPAVRQLTAGQPHGACRPPIPWIRSECGGFGACWSETRDSANAGSTVRRLLHTYAAALGRSRVRTDLEVRVATAMTA